jgi:hypothetical protein
MASWAPQVHVDGEWSGNSLRFETKMEAEAWASALLTRWFVPSDSRAIESDDPVNYRLNADGTVEAVK